MPPLWAEATNRACVRFNINFEFNLIHKFTFTERRQMNNGGMLNRIVIGSEFLSAVYLNFERLYVSACGLIELSLFLCFSQRSRASISVETGCRRTCRLPTGPGRRVSTDFSKSAQMAFVCHVECSILSCTALRKCHADSS